MVSQIIWFVSYFFNMLASTLCYIRRHNQTLMLHRVKKDRDIHQDKWNGLGGKFEPGESPEECVCREVKEESGLALTNPTLRGVMTFPLFDGNQDWMVFLFTATEFEDSMFESDEGKLEWIDNDKLVDLNLWEGDKLFFEWLEQDRFFSAKFVYKDKKLIKHDVIFY